MKCQDCKTRKGVIIFCESTLHYSHGFEEHICRQCYIKRMEETINGCKKQILEQKKLIKKELK